MEQRSLRAGLVRHGLVWGLSGLLSATCLFATPALADTADDLAAARSKLEEIGRKTDQTNRELEELSGALEQTQGEIETKQAELSDRQTELSGYISSEYKASGFNIVRFLLSSDSFESLLSHVFYMNKVADAQAELITSVRTIKDELTQKQADQEKSIATAKDKVEELNARRADASATVNALDSKLQEELTAEAAANAALTAGLQASQQQQVTGPVADENRGETSNPTPAPNPDPAPAPSPEPEQKPQTKPEPDYNPVTGNAVVDRAYSYIGKAEYVWGACAPGQFDCSGFVSYCLTGQYTRLGSTKTFMTWTRVSDPQPGDVCTSWSHCGIYIGNGQMIHASTWGVGVIKSPVRSNMIYVRR